MGHPHEEIWKVFCAAVASGNIADPEKLMRGLLNAEALYLKTPDPIIRPSSEALQEAASDNEPQRELSHQ